MTAPVSGRPAPGPTGAGTAAVAGLAGSAALVAALTLAARLVGFGRVFAFSATVGAGCTGDAYAAANQLPNVLFEVVAGGALAGAVVPAVAAAMARGGAGEAGRVASALLSWSLLVLTPVALLLAAVAGPLTGLFLRDPTCGGFGDVATRMLVVFAPQVPLYGIGIVLGGVLQAHHRFAGPALAPLLSSAVVIAAYLAYAALAGPAHGAVGFVPSRGAELMLAGGTTLGVVALSLPLLVPVRRAGVRLRPTLRFPPGTAAGVRALATAGVAALLAQQAAVVVVLAVTTRIGGVGAINVYQQYGQAVYLLPYAVLAVPVATAAFPRLARQAADGDRAAFAAPAPSPPAGCSSRRCSARGCWWPPRRRPSACSQAWTPSAALRSPRWRTASPRSRWACPAGRWWRSAAARSTRSAGAGPPRRRPRRAGWWSWAPRSSPWPRCAPPARAATARPW